MAETKFVARYELSDQQTESARREGLRLTNNKSIPQLRGMCIALCMENMRLALELNAHRAALGQPLLPVFDVKG